mmetsp:Transcript_61366/g.143669  ORF Transcript_61366/g.143669 Transcript_61366/m.143669 type:complete len:223 (+) Transcript_61366:777-1445(+)
MAMTRWMTCTSSLSPRTSGTAFLAVVMSLRPATGIAPSSMAAACSFSVGWTSARLASRTCVSLALTHGHGLELTLTAIHLLREPSIVPVCMEVACTFLEGLMGHDGMTCTRSLSQSSCLVEKKNAGDGCRAPMGMLRLLQNQRLGRWKALLLKIARRSPGCAYRSWSCRSDWSRSKNVTYAKSVMSERSTLLSLIASIEQCVRDALTRSAPVPCAGRPSSRP